MKLRKFSKKIILKQIKKSGVVIGAFFYIMIPISANSGTIQGYVYEETNGLGLAHTFVTLYSGDCASRIEIDSVATGDATIPGQQTGEYKFENVPNGSYRLHAEPMLGQYAPEWGKSSYDAYTCDQADIITLSDTTTTVTLNFFVDKGASITGSVFLSDGTTAVTWDNSYIEVYAVDVNDCSDETNFHKYRIQMHETFSDGTYSLALGPGQYYLIADPYIYDNTNPIELKREWWLTDKSSPICSQGMPLTITSNLDDHPGINFQLDNKSNQPFSWNLFLPAILNSN